jgi:hypothetical protein
MLCKTARQKPRDYSAAGRRKGKEGRGEKINRKKTNK